MKLINPGSGDFIDRYTILVLKIHHGPVPRAAGEKDRSGESSLESAGILEVAPWIDKRLCLAMRIMMINTLMWVATEELDEAISTASSRVSSDSHTGYVATRLRQMNLKRAELVAELSGCDEAMEETAKEEIDV